MPDPNPPRRRLYPYLLLAALLTLLCCVAAGCGGDSGLSAAAPAATLTGTLPALSELAGSPASQRKHVSEATYELLSSTPMDWSAAGMTWSAGSLSLDPVAAGGLAWAIFKLSGFPDDGAVYPTAVTIDKDLPAPCYLAVSNYARSTWDFFQVFGTSPVVPLSSAAGLLSPAPTRSFYVAVLADEFALHATSLRVTCSADLPGGPSAVLNVLSSKSAFGWPTRFDATGSDGGDGTITSITYDFGDGSPTYSPPSADPTEVVEHTYMSTGAKIATVTVENDQARSDIDGAGVDVGDTEKEVLVVYNDNIPESEDLAMYYGSPESGRSIDRQYILGLTMLAADVPENVDRTTVYEPQIRDAIRSWLDSPENASFVANIKYILLCKGVPHKINGDNEFDYNNSTCSSVDSELCTMYSDGTYPLPGSLWNEKVFQAFQQPTNSQSFYMSHDTSFTPKTFKVSDSTGTTYNLDYLVGRLAGYSYADAKASVDRALQADTTGSGWIVFDSRADQTQYDTMVDPVWPLTGPPVPDDPDWHSGAQMLTDAGFNVVADITDPRIDFTWPALQPDHYQNVLGYCSWGVHSGWPTTYILSDLGFTYRPGAVFMSYESFNATTFSCTNPDDPTIDHAGQGQIMDFIHTGGTVAIGNAWEPFTVGVGDERWVFDRYIDHGDRWIEAAYKGLRLLSWQEVVVGDPLCRVQP